MSNKPLMPSLTEPFNVVVGARTSPLSRAQVKEVQAAMQPHHPKLTLEPLWVATIGDKDLQTSLRSLEKTDFFTQEIDSALLEGKCRVGIHSAKDLPEPLPKGLRLVAVTKGMDPSDVLVLRQGETLETLPAGARIATSSERREETVRQLRQDLTFIDLRGTIDQRLKKLDSGEADGVVVAEAALIRLGLAHLNRVTLPGGTVPGQGQLAIVVRDNDAEIKKLFSCLDSRRTVLHLGLEPPQSCLEKSILHCPLIKISFRGLHHQIYQNLHHYTHIIFTSKTAVDLFFDIFPDTTLLEGKTLLAVGKKTAQRIQKRGGDVAIVAQNETAEGLVEELQKLPLDDAYCLWPHSALSRPVLSDFFRKNNIPCDAPVLYNTYAQQPDSLPDLAEVDEIYFTSPSTVEAFMHLYGELPADKILTPIGPVTSKHLFSYCPQAAAAVHSRSTK